MLGALVGRYQVSIYRTIGPLVELLHYITFALYLHYIYVTFSGEEGYLYDDNSVIP